MPETCSTWAPVVRDLGLAMIAAISAGAASFFAYKQVLARWARPQSTRTRRDDSKPKPKLPSSKD